MWETIIIFAGMFIVLSAGLWFFIRQTTRRRHDAIARGRFDFDAFKAREIARRGIHDTTRIGKPR
jgi:hypothetical protein